MHQQRGTMPAAISAPTQSKIIELYKSGSKLKDIAQLVAVGRNAVARIVQAYIDKNAAAPKAIGAADFTQDPLFKLRYLLDERVGIGQCPKCGTDFGYMATDNKAKCARCGTVLSLS